MGRMRIVGSGAALLVFLGSLGGVGYGLHYTDMADSPANRATNALADIGVAIGIGITVIFVIVATASGAVCCALRPRRPRREPRHPCCYDVDRRVRDM